MKPKPNEPKSMFMKRCIPIVMEEQVKDIAQAEAICFTYWDITHSE